MILKWLFKFGSGHHAEVKTIKVDFNPDKLTVYANDIQPIDLEHYRDSVPANRP